MSDEARLLRLILVILIAAVIAFVVIKSKDEYNDRAVTIERTR